LGATLNWRRDPGYEQRVMQYEQRKMQHEWRMKQLESDILRVRNDSERIKRETEQLRQDNAREKALSASIRRLCFPPESSSIPQTPTGPDCKPSSP
jgi:hypothetical protein